MVREHKLFVRIQPFDDDPNRWIRDRQNIPDELGGVLWGGSSAGRGSLSTSLRGRIHWGGSVHPREEDEDALGT